MVALNPARPHFLNSEEQGCGELLCRICDSREYPNRGFSGGRRNRWGAAWGRSPPDVSVTANVSLSQDWDQTQLCPILTDAWVTESGSWAWGHLGIGRALASSCGCDCCHFLGSTRQRLGTGFPPTLLHPPTRSAPSPQASVSSSENGFVGIRPSSPGIPRGRGECFVICKAHTNVRNLDSASNRQTDRSTNTCLSQAYSSSLNS